MATAVSAAEMAMENKEKKYPSSPPGNRKRLNTAKLMSVAFRISSMLISIASVDACEKHDSRNYQIIFHVYHNSYLLRAINNPPTIHANNKMLTASKGSR